MVYGTVLAHAGYNEGMHQDTNENMPSLCIGWFGPNLQAFLHHLLAAAHQGNAAGIFGTHSAGAGFGDR